MFCLNYYSLSLSLKGCPVCISFFWEACPLYFLSLDAYEMETPVILRLVGIKNKTFYVKLPLISGIMISEKIK